MKRVAAFLDWFNERRIFSGTICFVIGRGDASWPHSVKRTSRSQVCSKMTYGFRQKLKLGSWLEKDCDGFSTVQFWWASALGHLRFPVLGGQAWNSVWSSALGLTCCAFWGPFLLSTSVKSGLSWEEVYCNLNNQSERSALTSLLNEAFPPAELLFTGYSGVKIPDQQFLKYRN